MGKYKSTSIPQQAIDLQNIKKLYNQYATDRKMNTATQSISGTISVSRINTILTILQEAISVQQDDPGDLKLQELLENWKKNK